MDNNMVLTLLTRIGPGSRMVLNGDPNQVDIPGRNGIRWATQLLQGLDGVGIVEFGLDDIQRHPLITQILERVAVENPYRVEGHVWA